MECVSGKDLVDNLRKLLYAGKTNMSLVVIEAQSNPMLPEEHRKEIDKLTDLYSCFSENKEALLDLDLRSIMIPETYPPGEIHHARLDGTESKMFTLNGNRMKGGRCC